VTYIIAEPCIGTKDGSCVEVCPVDCIYGYTGSDTESFPNQLYINPEECIDCGVCEPECPWEAIYEDERVPEVFAEDVGQNAKVPENQGDFEVPEVEEKDKPTEDQVKANKQKWNFNE